jgi:hypothetical protein
VIPRNRTRADKRAGGLRELSVWLTSADREAVHSEAVRRGLSDSGLVKEWVAYLREERPEGQE